MIERLRNPGDDLRATLEDVAYRLIRSCCTERSRSLRWLTYGQVAQFLDVMVGRTSDQLSEAIADRLARLSLSGRLRPSDPGTAAEQFLVLITGPMEGRTRLGARKVSTAEMRVVAAAAVDILLVRLWDAGGSLSFGITPKSITETHDALSLGRERTDVTAVHDNLLATIEAERAIFRTFFKFFRIADTQESERFSECFTPTR